MIVKQLLRSAARYISRKNAMGYYVVKQFCCCRVIFLLHFVILLYALNDQKALTLWLKLLILPDTLSWSGR